jgi:serine/threonine protein kinase/tetratricopeptide (TPR) repeat protein
VVGATVGPYQVIARLGAGGMGEVFLGHDPRLQRRVALKCLSRTDTQSAEARARILREARAAARLNHPNIAAIYDVLEEGDRTFIVMEYVEGENLALRIGRGRLPIDEVRALGRQLASALAAAHAQGVIHRDLKPANVHVTRDGSIKVLDFGVAKISPALGLSGADTGTALVEATLPGNPGTPIYMSPEQLFNRGVDARSDVYSAGVMLFEAVTGRRPYLERGAVPLAVAMNAAPAPAASTINPDVPPDLDATIARALERDPGNRFSSASAFLDALTSTTAVTISRSTVRPPRRLTWPMAALALAVVLVVAGGEWLYRHGPITIGPSVAKRDVVAVLPLENLSGDPSKAYLGAGVSETLTMALSKVPSLTVLSRGDVLDVVRRERDVRSIARQLDASFIVDGSVQEASDRIRITLRVVRPDATVAWSEVYEDSTAAVFALHRTMAVAIVDKIKGASPDQADLTIPGTSNVEALTVYWQGRSLLDRAVTRNDFDNAAAAFRHSVALDARFALGYAGLADTYWQQYQVTHDSALPTQALEAGLNALRLDPGQPATRVAVATVYQGMGQYDAAIDQLKRVFDLQPSNDDAHRIYARVLNAQGKPDEALNEFQQAAALRPHRWVNYSELAAFYYQQRRLSDAVATYERALEIVPNDARIFLSLGAMYLEMGDVPRSLQLFERANAIAPTGRALANMGTAYYRLGRFADAVDAYGAAARLDSLSPLLHGNLGDAYLRLNRTADATREFALARVLTLDALKVNDKDFRSLSRLGAFEAKLGMANDATTHAARAVAIAPRDPDVRYKQAVVYALIGQKAEALQALKQALALGYQGADAQADYDLAAIKASPEFARIIAGQS